MLTVEAERKLDKTEMRIIRLVRARKLKEGTVAR